MRDAANQRPGATRAKLRVDPIAGHYWPFGVWMVDPARGDVDDIADLGRFVQTIVWMPPSDLRPSVEYCSGEIDIIKSKVILAIERSGAISVKQAV